LLDYDRKRLRGLVLEEGTANFPCLDRGARARHPRGRRSAECGSASPIPAMPSSSMHLGLDLCPALGGNRIGPMRKRVRFRARRQAQYLALRDKPCVTKDGQPVELMINAGLIIDLPHIEDTGSAGIGLFRTELQFMVGQSLPRTSDQLALYRARCWMRRAPSP